MKKTFIWNLLTACFIVAAAAVTVVAASGNILPSDKQKPDQGNIFVEVEGTYSSAGASKVLSTINKIRYLACRNKEPESYGSSAKLHLDTDYGPNPTAAQLARDNGSYHPVKWSRDLERACEIRACEADMLMQHDRPNGTSCFTADKNINEDWGGTGGNGCLAWNSNSGAGLVTYGIGQWEDERDIYLGKKKGEWGHYYGLINPSLRYIGLAAFTFKADAEGNGPYYNWGCIAYHGRTDRTWGDPLKVNETPINRSGKYFQTVELKPELVTSLSLSGDKATCPGGSCNLVLKAKYSLSSLYRTYDMESKVSSGIKWSSSDTSVAKVSSSGVVTGVSEGTVTITAAASGKTSSMTIKVKKPVVIKEKNITVAAGSDHTIKAEIYSSKVSWTSSDTSVATVNDKGQIKALAAGSAVITAKVPGGYKTSVNVRVLYKDVTDSSDFWYTPTNELTDKGIVKGYDKQTRFKPANECTRAQMLTFMWRLAGSPAPGTSKCRFPDVKKTDYFYKPVIWAMEKGITTGYKDGTFRPQNVCTRGQTVTFLWRMAGSPLPSASGSKFKDISKEDYFYKPVLWASAKKIVAGYNDNTFRPQGKCLRRQMVTFLYKYGKNLGK